MLFDDGVGRVPVLRVKREGGRGWKWINATAFDPAAHELFDGDADGDEGDMTQDAPRRRGRPPKVQSEQLRGDES